MNRVGKVKEWRVVSQDDSNKGSLFVSRSTLSTHKEEPEDDKSPTLDSSSADDAQINLADFVPESFQQNTDSLYDNSSWHPSSSNTGDGVDVHSNIDSSKNLLHDVVKPSGLNSWTPLPLASGLSSTFSDNLPPTSVPIFSDNNPTVQTSEQQQEKRSIDMKPGNDVIVSGAVVTELDAVDSNMKNLKLGLDTHTTSQVQQQWQGNMLQQYGFSALVQSDHIPMTPHGTHLPRVPFVDNLSHTQLKLPTGNMQQLLPQPGMTAPFYTPNSFGSPYYQSLHPASVLPTPYGTAGYSLGGSGLPPFMTSYSPQSSVATPLDSTINPSFSGRPSGFPSAGNLTAGTEFVQPYKMYGQLGYAMQPPIPDPNFFPFFQHPSFPQYVSGNQYNMLAPRGSVFGNVADNFDPQKLFPQAQYPSDQRLELPKTGISNSPTAPIGGTVPNYHGISPYVGVPLTYPTSPVFQGQPFSGISPSGRRNDSARFQSASRDMTAISGIHGQRERGKFDNPKACTFLEELKSNRARRVELSDITGRIVEFSADQHGSRFIQQKLENCTAEEKASVFAEVLPHAPSLMTDVFGNYVIQKRVLEHCGGDPQGQRIIDEILQSACILAQDQYGNYVTQHVLEKGTSNERAQIISKLAGQVVTMSQNKFASNVIEKCFQHGDIAERDLLIREIVEQTEGNDSLLAMMKDQYANYVVQKILETCNDQQRELLVSRVKGHVQALRKYTYGKHIASRVEQLCGEGDSECES
uniref:Uncharacterized protein n=1 Tax=Avena sativa TaxID=4498 RepID=A0ACD5ZV50_AVESA